ncbi:MAG: transglycosylase SLT domain-containing protein, partial [Chloroflexi bacterium]|nr:transglycosylase SLT domain-containing protein [Chloroflexota bacterium]
MPRIPWRTSPAGLRVATTGRPRYPGAARLAPGPRLDFRSVLARVAPRQERAPLARASAAPRLPDDLGPLVAEAGRRYGVDPSLIAGVMEAESGFDPDAVSPAGARGLMQLMESTARSLGVDDPLDPTQSVLGGAKLLG